MSRTVVGVIPARRGSSRLPGKNALNLGHDSLVGLAIRAANDCGVISHLIVTSDDPRILLEAERSQVRHVQVRPKHLATSTASMADVVVHAIEELSQANGIHADVVVTLQPTSPLRSAHDVRQALYAWEQEPLRPLATCALPLQAARDLVIREGNQVVRPLIHHRERVDDQSVVFIDGSVYVTPGEYLMEKRSIFDLTEGRLLEIDPLRAVDVDHAFQLELARRLVQSSISVSRARTESRTL